LRWLDQPLARDRLTAEFDALHRDLRREASRQAAEAIVELLRQKIPASIARRDS
jgi:lipid A disaccharide synthetase